LPPGFSARLSASGLLDRVNRRFGTMLDLYEEEDVASPIVLSFIAGQLGPVFADRADEGVASELTGVLVAAAQEGQCLTFRLWQREPSRVGSRPERGRFDGYFWC
jgi:hypothetical protein